MSALPFYIVDVFAERKYAGNQLAVVCDDGLLSDHDMQQIAREMNYSETTFIRSDAPGEAGYAVRIFTPQAEVPFAGHPTLGTAYVIHREFAHSDVDTITLDLKVGSIPVTISYDDDGIDTLWMKQIQPSFGRAFRADALRRVLELDAADLDGRYPIMEVSTGLPFIIVPLKTREALTRATINRKAYFELIRGAHAKAILIFCAETDVPSNDLSVRVFADYYGVPEDPATGSANGCLAGYLSRYRYFGKNHIDVRVEQGSEVGRPSLLFLHAHTDENGIDVRVGGHVVMVARGELV